MITDFFSVLLKYNNLTINICNNLMIDIYNSLVFDIIDNKSYDCMIYDEK